MNSKNSKNSQNSRNSSQNQNGNNNFPKEWQIVRLGEVCSVQSGGTPSKKEKSYWENGTIKWLGSSVCKNLHYIDEITDYITQKGLRNSSAKIFKQGTTLIALVGATIGKVAFLDFEAATNQNIAGIYPQNENILNKNFLFYISLMLYREFEKLSSDKFGMANLSFVKSLKIPLPPLKEQEKIALILSLWDKGIDTLEKLISTKILFKKALMQRLLTPPKNSQNAPATRHSVHSEESTLKIKGDSTTRHSERSEGEESTAQKKSLEFKGYPNSLDSSLRATHSAQNDGVVGAYNDGTNDERGATSLRFAEFKDEWQGGYL